MTTTSTIPWLIGGLGGTELLIILAVLVLLFGASKLPDLARGSGQALRIFKAETKGLVEGDENPRDEAIHGEAILDETARPDSARPDSTRPDSTRRS